MHEINNMINNIGFKPTVRIFDFPWKFMMIIMITIPDKNKIDRKNVFGSIFQFEIYIAKDVSYIMDWHAFLL